MGFSDCIIPDSSVQRPSRIAKNWSASRRGMPIFYVRSFLSTARRSGRYHQTRHIRLLPGASKPARVPVAVWVIL